MVMMLGEGRVLMVCEVGLEFLASVFGPSRLQYPPYLTQSRLSGRLIRSWHCIVRLIVRFPIQLRCTAFLLLTLIV
jgi:hypothetical protein